MICSEIPIAKLPLPSKDFALTPRKSRTRGIATEITRSRQSYIRARRSVPLHPVGQPSRILNPAMDFLALVITGCCPEIRVSSATALSRTFLSATASPTPILSVILVMRGTSMIFASLSSSRSFGASSVRYRSCSLLISLSSGVLQWLAAGFEYAKPGAIFPQADPHPIRFSGGRVVNRDVGGVNGRLALQNAPGHAHLRV